MDISQLTETEIRSRYIYPEILKKNWDPHEHIREEYDVTKGQVLVSGQG